MIVGPAMYRVVSGRVGSGRVVSGVVGSGWIGLGQTGPGWVDSGKFGTGLFIRKLGITISLTQVLKFVRFREFVFLEIPYTSLEKKNFRLEICSASLVIK